MASESRSDDFIAAQSTRCKDHLFTVVCALLPKFHYIYLAQNLLKTRSPTSFEQKKVGDLVSDKIDLSRHDRSSGKFSTNKKVGDLVADKSVTSFRQKKSETWSRSPTFFVEKIGDQVSDLSATWSPTSWRQVVRQDRSNGIWAYYSQLCCARVRGKSTKMRTNSSFHVLPALAVQRLPLTFREAP